LFARSASPLETSDFDLGSFAFWEESLPLSALPLTLEIGGSFSIPHSCFPLALQLLFAILSLPWFLAF
jgi:hypothetical protein